MRTRAISSVGVVVVGLLPAILGGPVFAALMAMLGIVGYWEFSALAARVGGGVVLPRIGLLAGLGFAIAALAGDGNGPVLGVAAAAVGAPLIALLLRRDATGAFVAWALAAAGSVYLGLPIYAAVALRGTAGATDAEWLDRLADGAALGWEAAPRGLAWILVVISATWLGDTMAYLVGRSMGRHPLVPRVSPNKTVEGAVGGLAGSALAGGLGVALFGLDVGPPLGALVGGVVGAVGQVGDLAESLLKRQAGVKDSGGLIPGHGGALDRIDALLFALPVGWLVADLVDRSAR